MSRTKSIYNETLASKYNNKDILSKSVDKILDYQWNFYEKDIFINCNFSGNKIPDQGWKIHVSCTLKNALDILNIVTETLIKEKVNFKYVLNCNNYCDNFLFTQLIRVRVKILPRVFGNLSIS
ncbi:class III lanthionine synthetase LanKC N-terminal domain-containing protein [Ruoffia tabacinasalis]